MEFDKPSTKYMFIGILVVFAFIIGFLMFKMFELDRNREAKSKANQEACNQLDIKMYDAVKVKNDKFYEDEVFYAIKKFSEVIEVKRPFDENEKNNLRFLCSDLVKTEDPYKEIFQ